MRTVCRIDFSPDDSPWPCESRAASSSCSSMRVIEALCAHVCTLYMLSVRYAEKALHTAEQWSLPPRQHTILLHVSGLAAHS